MTAAPVRHQVGGQSGVLVWDLLGPVRALSSAPVGGGLSEPRWLLNIGVPIDYSRTDLEAHAAEVAAEVGLDGPGVALLTAADVRMAQRAEVDGVIVDATVGISKPTWAADPSGKFTPWRPGTINIVVHVPVALTDAAAVNAVITATEAKTQALMDANVPGTGTASDAIVILSPLHQADAAQPDNLESVPVAFAGPRSPWGAAIAQAVHAAVASGIVAAASPLDPV